ncbi:MCE family protein [Candidatus Mycobacterium wuenschmannii]|uniref:MCE family protein n=1 Tax=Candidatus Mycobacterium wuenschmannii TaxID=3027808 RepID=A0ABY8VWQ0_9MYCO|nr:MCE family protein [Candidatus Mycobacterium wuenschmannii]WIM88070.1 MCE family protein [Candidatus Mycobacterium wuenschmannii]
MLTRLIRWQLAIFATVTVVAVGAVAILYLRLPTQLGIGTYSVTANFAASGGLYANANVTYRGATIGRVTAITLTKNRGVDAHLTLNSKTPIPANVTASVKSRSAIGEQFLDLTPPPGASSSLLHNGSHIDRAHTVLSQDVTGLLAQTDQLVNSVRDSRIRELLHQTFQAFDGTGPELARLIQSTQLLIHDANADSAEATALIDQAGPFLDAQLASGPQINRIADGLARLTTHLNSADPQIRDLLSTTPQAATYINTAFTGIRPTFPILAANLANAGRIGVIYHKSIEQALVLIPALTAMLITVAGQSTSDEGVKADFKLNLGAPPPCLTGFLSPHEIRTPGDLTLRDVPKDLYCKVPQSDPTVVRGARNYPCQEFPGKRAPTVQLCRDPKGYEPIGSNPWRGPPVPTGIQPTNPRNILPPNNYPYIPPGVDYDPGNPVVHLPPGVAPGPGPALVPPYPTQAPPADGPRPPPLPYKPPSDQRVPPYGQSPAASNSAATATHADPVTSAEPAVVTYDQHRGTYLDPASGQIGVFASGAKKIATPENWVDLMTYPRTD